MAGGEEDVKAGGGVGGSGGRLEGNDGDEGELPGVGGRVPWGGGGAL